MTGFSTALRHAPPTAWFGMVVVGFYIFVSIFAPLLAPYGENEVLTSAFEPWGESYIFGTDNLGRDMMTRLIYGARNTVAIALMTTFLAFFVGTFTGLLAAAMGGWIDQLLGRIVDVAMAIPSLIFALLMLTIVGTGTIELITVIAVIEATRVFRVARATAINIVVMEYVEAARLRGEKLSWLIFREVLPNAAPPLVAEFGLRFIFVFLFISALSFLGLGIQPPSADWGSMVRDNATLITYSDITPLLPAGAIALLTIAVNFIVDWVLHIASGLKE